MIDAHTKEQWELPWEDVERSRNNKRLQKKHPDPQIDKYEFPLKPCPECKTRAKDLSWFYFESPKSTWEHLCGRAGWIVVCDKCHERV